jgi:hypothetical protein
MLAAPLNIADGASKGARARLDICTFKITDTVKYGGTGIPYYRGKGALIAHANANTGRFRYFLEKENQ